MRYLAKDIFKCMKVAFLISIIIFVLFSIIYYLFYGNSSVTILYFIKDRLYNIGCLGFLISVGFFMQRNATRPLTYRQKWETMFRKLNLGIVIMVISLFICIYGMVIQSFIE